MVRSFIAVDIPVEVAKELLFRAKALEEKNYKPVKPENIHLTLKFLGNVELKVLEELYFEIKKELKDFQRFSFSIGSFGAFPGEKSALVAWFGVERGKEKLADLYSAVNKATLKFGFKEDKRFVPHLTVGRFKKPRNIAGIAARIREEAKVKHVVEVNSVKIYKSTLTQGGPIYEVLYEISLK